MSAQVLVRLPAELHSALQAAAAERGLSSAQQLRDIASKALTGRPAPRRHRRVFVADPELVGSALCQLGMATGMLKQVAVGLRIAGVDPALRNRLEVVLDDMVALQRRIDAMASAEP